jgi:diaminopimelate decarboxylase/aspartate kinase
MKSSSLKSLDKSLQPGAPWVVAKFGGTSVATPERWRQVARIVASHRAAGSRVLLVCSAVAGVTNRLAALLATLDDGDDPAAELAALTATHRDLAADLGLAATVADADLAGLAARARAATAPLSPAERAAIMAHGELLSTRLGAAFLADRGLDVTWMDARDLLDAEPEGDRAERYLSARCEPAFRPAVRARLDRSSGVVITQGFIARGEGGETVLLGRGGSDASAGYLGAAIAAAAIELWSDVPGMFTADPRAVPSARLLRRLSFGEAETLGALGAKVVHPRCIEPARAAGIPIRLGWTARPDVEGTRIVGARPPRGAKAIVSRSELVLVTMWRPSSWQPVGFMAEVASRFHRHGLSMDLIASSPSEIRATVDLAAFPSAADDLEPLMAELAEVCRPRLLPRVACVSAVGAGVAHELLRSAGGLTPFADTPVHLISHAANGGHVSVVVDERDAAPLVAAAHEVLVAPERDESTFGPRWTVMCEAPVEPPLPLHGATRDTREAS